MSAYYNEFDKYAAQWLRNLIKAGHLPAGDVDERSIRDVAADDVAGYTQCHWFAGIGGWALACRIAGWPDDREIWTGSPPCQPFSVAGRGKAQADDRHLWPDLFRLIRGRRPADFVGEQVAAAIRYGWLDGVFSDMEGIGYSCEAIDAPACAVDAPHRRDRVWIAARRGALADTAGEGPQGIRAEWSARQGQERPTIERDSQRVFDGDVADTDQPRASKEREQPGGEFARACGDSGACDGTSPWSGHQWITGHDGKARRIPGPESGIRLLAHGVPARVGRLRAYGNAIVPTLGAQVIAALMECAP